MLQVPTQTGEWDILIINRGLSVQSFAHILLQRQSNSLEPLREFDILEKPDWQIERLGWRQNGVSQRVKRKGNWKRREAAPLPQMDSCFRRWNARGMNRKQGNHNRSMPGLGHLGSTQTWKPRAFKATHSNRLRPPAFLSERSIAARTRHDTNHMTARPPPSPTELQSHALLFCHAAPLFLEFSPFPAVESADTQTLL